MTTIQVIGETGKIKLRNVRLSFPSLFKKAVFQGQEGKYAATFLIPKSAKGVKEQLDKLIEAKVKEAKIKVKAENLCLKDGDDEEYDGYADHWSIKASNSKRPQVFNKDGSPLTEEDEVVYAGCYVDVIFDLWAQDNQWGKRINANLLGVKFHKDGEPFGSGSIDVSDEFDFDDESDDDEI